jgi:hypothetical protein
LVVGEVNARHLASVVVSMWPVGASIAKDGWSKEIGAVALAGLLTFQRS